MKMNKSFIVLLIVGVFLTSAVRSEEKPCKKQKVKQIVCQLLEKQQEPQPPCEPDLSPVLDAISSLREEAAKARNEERENLDNVVNKLKEEIVDEVLEAIEAAHPPPPKEYQSCKEIYDDGGRESKAYDLSLEGGKRSVFCHMSDDDAGCGKGGFTLVMKTDGHKNTFHYDSALWTNEDSHNIQGGSTGFDNQETKLPTYSQTPLTKLCLGMKVGAGETKFISINHAAGSLHSLIADGQYRATSLGRNAWKSLIADSSIQSHCNVEGFNAVGTRSDLSRARIGITSNNENNCESNDSRIGFGGGGHPDNSVTCGDVAKYGGDNGDKTIKAFGYILVQ